MRLLCVLTCATTVLLTRPARGSDFQDTQYGYAVSPPEFSAAPMGGAVKRLIVMAPPGADGFGPNMGVMIQEVQTTRDKYMSLSERQFEDAGMKVRSSSKREVSGTPAVLFEYEGPMNGRNLRFLSLAVVLRDRVLLLTYTATAESFGGLEKEFRRSLESFRLARR